MKRILLGILFALWSPLALAQGCGQANPNCIVPTAPIGTNNNQAASTAFVQQNALTAAALFVPFTQSLTVSSNLATVAGFGFNPISFGLLATDSASCTCPTPGQNIPTLLSVQENFGGSSINNGRIASSAYLNMTGATSATNAYPFYVAQNAYAQTLVNDNGTSGTPRGVLEGIVSAFRLAGAATFWNAAVGVEILTDIETGASARSKANLLLDNFAGDTVQGTLNDTWIWTYASTGSVGKNTWSQIDAAGGVFALTSSATVIKLIGSNTIATGLDFGGLTVSGNVLQWASSAWKLTGSGNATLNAVTASNLSFAGGASVSVGSCTGLGASGTCALNTGSTPQNGKITLTVAGAGPAAAGALTLTFGSALGADDTSCRAQVQDGTGAWPVQSVIQAQTSSTTTAVLTWRAASALTAGSTYQIEYQCFGM